MNMFSCTLVWTWMTLGDTNILPIYTTLIIFSMKYLVMCKIYTDVGGIK